MLASGTLKFAVFACLGFALGGCASGRIFGDNSKGYDGYVEDRVEVAKIYQKGRVLLTAKALAADAELFRRQNEYTPSHAFEYRAGQSQVIVALGMSTAEVFANDDFKFFLAGRPHVKIAEILNLADIEHHYPFAYPFLRVFLVDFEKIEVAGSRKFAVHSPVGMVEIELEFAGGNPGTAAVGAEAPWNP